jgi:hypothetical protein
MSVETPTIGGIVIYTLSESDEYQINRRRQDATEQEAGLAKTGYIVHVGNKVQRGQSYPAIVVRAWNDDGVNLQVFLDGNDVFWATSKLKCGTDEYPPGTENRWHWPIRVKENS